MLATNSVLMGRQLLNGQVERRRRLADDVVASGDPHRLSVLIDTVRSTGRWQLRARSLEALGPAAANADQTLPEEMLRALCALPKGPRAKRT
jgi:hypothetical protein